MDVKIIQTITDIQARERLNSHNSFQIVVPGCETNKVVTIQIGYELSDSVNKGESWELVTMIKRMLKPVKPV